MDLEIALEEIEDKVVLRIEGRLDTVTSPALEERITALVKENHAHLLADFSKIDYLSSAGMRLLLSASKKAKAANGYLVLFSVSDEVMEIIKMAGFDRILLIRKNEQEALQYNVE